MDVLFVAHIIVPERQSLSSLSQLKSHAADHCHWLPPGFLFHI
jgi:hypothetical protein